MKRLYTCIVQAEDNQGPNIQEYHRIKDVIRWINKNGIDIHKNAALAGECIHQCLNDNWALLLCNGQRMALKQEVIPLFPTKVPEVGEK